MGRPPIGKEAMSDAERQRRRRERLRDSRPVTKPAKPDGGPQPQPAFDTTREIAALKKELARAKARIVQLEAAPPQAAPDTAEIASLKQGRDKALEELRIVSERLNDGHRVIAEAKAILAAKAFMPADIYKTVLYSAHPDRVTDLKWKMRFEKAFQFLRENERMLAKKPPPPVGRDLPTLDEMLAMKWRKKEEQKAKRAAKRAAKKNPPKSLGRC